MWEATGEGVVLPLVEGGAARVLRLRTAGLPESDSSQLVKELAEQQRGLDLAFCVTRFGVDLLLRTEDEHLDLEAVAAPFVESLGRKLYTVGEQDLPEVVGEMLRARHQTVAVAESCTGGLLGADLTSQPGSSAWFVGGVLAYSDAVKEKELGVPAELLRTHGAVSREVAEAMARGARERFATDWALSVTGIAGPDGGTPEKPVGTVHLALSGGGSMRARALSLPGDREQNRYWTVAAALDLLRRTLQYGDDTP